MKCLIFSDLHLHRWSEFNLPTRDGLGTRFWEGMEVLEYVMVRAREEVVDAVFFCGDLFHDGGRVFPMIYAVVMEQLLKMLRKASFPLFLLPGQHDHCFGGESRGTALHPLAHIADKEGRLHILPVNPSCAVWDKWILLTCGHHKPKEALVRQLRKLEKEAEKEVNSVVGPVIFLGHFLVKELLVAGDDAFLTSAIDADDLPFYRSREGDGRFWWFLGDYHRSAEVEDKHLYSIGSTHHHTFSDSDRPLGRFLIVDTESGEVQSETIPSRRFRTLMFNEIKEWDGYDYCRVRCKNLEEAEWVKENIQSLERVRIVLEETSSSNPIRLRIHNPHDPESIIRQYCQYMGQPHQVERGMKYVGGDRAS